MAKRDKHILGKLEMLIMQIVWEKKEATVQQVRDAIASQRDLAYSTILTMMRKMEKKGLLDHRTEDRKYIYRPIVQKHDVERSMLRDLLNTVFDGSYRQFINSFVEHEDLSPEELIDLVRKAEEDASQSDEV